MFWIYLLSSFFLISFGQPARLAFLGPCVAAFGFACFWKAMLRLENKKSRFWLALFWFSGAHMIQLSWMTSIHYMGPLILVVYTALNLGLGAQFALLSSFVQPSMKISKILGLCGLWVLFEWSRLFICTGFTWNPVGLFLSCSPYSLQMASLFGIYGLSFWVMLTNLISLSSHRFLPFCILALAPYGFGMWYIHSLNTQKNVFLRAALVQPAILPEQKDYHPSTADAFIPLSKQWERILYSIQVALQKNPGKIDLLVLPEGALPYGAYRCLYDLKGMEAVWQNCFGLESLVHFPPLQEPQARLEEGFWKVSNAYWAQALASFYKAGVLIGFDDEKYNAAFLFHPNGKGSDRYEKRVLVPISEYIPFGGIDFLADFIERRYHITGSFKAGSQAKVFFTSKLPIAVTICYEETYGEFSRQARALGAELLINITNDAWFPSSYLAKQHFEHGKIRSVENGVFVLRSCNTGVTGAVDRFGRVIEVLPESESKAETLVLSIPCSSHRTLYTICGDKVILCLSALFLICSAILDKDKKTLL